MHDKHTDVNASAGGILRWIDCHPRTGWYIAVIVTINLAVNLLQVFS